MIKAALWLHMETVDAHQVTAHAHTLSIDWYSGKRARAVMSITGWGLLIQRRTTTGLLGSWQHSTFKPNFLGKKTLQF